MTATGNEIVLRTTNMEDFPKLSYLKHHSNECSQPEQKLTESPVSDQCSIIALLGSRLRVSFFPA